MLTARIAALELELDLKHAPEAEADNTFQKKLDEMAKPQTDSVKNDGCTLAIRFFGGDATSRENSESNLQKVQSGPTTTSAFLKKQKVF